MAGEADQLARPYEAQAIYDQVRSHGQLLMFPHATHANCCSSNPERYWKTIFDWLGPAPP